MKKNFEGTSEHSGPSVASEVWELSGTSEHSEASEYSEISEISELEGNKKARFCGLFKGEEGVFFPSKGSNLP